MTPDEERRAAAVPGVPVADRMRALADAPWSERGDAATQAALREGADEVDDLRRELDFARRQREGDGDLIRRLYAEGGEYVERDKALRAEVDALRARAEAAEGDRERLRWIVDHDEQGERDDRAQWAQAAAKYIAAQGHEPTCVTVQHPGHPFEGCNCVVADIERGCMADVAYTLTRAMRRAEGRDALRVALADAQAVARGAQYREREARNEVAMLRGALDDAKRAGEVQRACALLQGTIAAIALDRWRRADDARAQADAGDLAGLARREAGPVTRRQWRACARCGREHWLADGEAAPLHGWVDPWGAAKTCAAVTVGEGSEGR